ncbi:hypothetical protein FRUB_00725 [Fimbriiglobus ruber]|uniref:Uncharacterized protein n=1 Tax=Fimbriiglobus ruber TaxID=1908690 RepID=A0A225EAH0_9BACT|nr:hypothetical protein FRUB_00725 [Fimbriiglobus ruber]
MLLRTPRTARSFARVAVAAALVVVAFMTTTASAYAQRKHEVRIADARVGLPAGRFSSETDADTQKAVNVIKRDTWAPVYVRLEMLREYPGGVALKVETTDADGLNTSATFPLASTLSGQLPGARLEPSELGAVPYVRSGDRGGEMKLTVVSTDGEKNISEPFHIRYIPFRDMSTYVVTSLGSRLPGFDLPRINQTGGATSGTTRAALRGGRVETSAITNVREMPDQWFGYQVSDLVVLTTGSAPGDFLDDLFDKEKSAPFKERRAALLEWVRRGANSLLVSGRTPPNFRNTSSSGTCCPRPFKPISRASRSANWSFPSRFTGHFARAPIRSPSRDWSFRRTAPCVSCSQHRRPTRPRRRWSCKETTGSGGSPWWRSTLTSRHSWITTSEANSGTG